MTCVECMCLSPWIRQRLSLRVMVRSCRDSFTLSLWAHLSEMPRIHTPNIYIIHTLTLHVSLRETRSLPSARRFAECRNTGTRQRYSLPSAALGKAGTQQRPSLSSAKHSAKRDTRQTSSLPSVRHSAKNNPRQNTSADAGGPSVILCRVLAVSTRQMFCLCRVLQACSDTRQSIFIFFLFLFSNFFYGIYTVP